MSEKSSQFDGKIRVAARIIDLLSSGLYHTPAACLKELVNNSYDAGAADVNVFVKPDADRIIIEDNGDGFSREEFTKHFDHVSETHKRDDDHPIQYGRKKIGKIGIGFIAANEICDKLELFSTKKGSRELLHVTIDFSAMRKSPEERRVGKTSEFVKADYVGEILEAKPAEHYTKLFLTSVRGEAKKILAGARNSAANKKAKVRSLYGLNAKSVGELLRTGNIRTWKEFDAYSQTMLDVGLNVPVRYHDSWAPTKLKTKATNITGAVTKLNFKVHYDGSELRKPIVFPPDVEAFIDRFRFKGKHVSANGYFYVQHGTISPIELQGLLVRVRHAAVGEYDSQFWGFPPTEASIIQRWVSAEIEADDGLEEAMNIDRRTLRIAHPAYVELQAALHEHFRSVLKKARQDLYWVARERRNKQRNKVALNELLHACHAELNAISPPLAKVVERQLRRNPSVSSKLATRKLSVIEMYQSLILTCPLQTSPRPERELGRLDATEGGHQDATSEEAFGRRDHPEAPHRGVGDCQGPDGGRSREEDRCHGADVISLAKRVRWTAHRPGETVEGTGEGERPAEAAAGRCGAG